MYSTFVWNVNEFCGKIPTEWASAQRRENERMREREREKQNLYPFSPFSSACPSISCLGTKAVGSLHNCSNHTCKGPAFSLYTQRTGQEGNCIIGSHPKALYLHILHPHFYHLRTGSWVIKGCFVLELLKHSWSLQVWSLPSETDTDVCVWMSHSHFLSRHCQVSSSVSISSSGGW